MSEQATVSEITTVIDGLHFAECLRWRAGKLYFSDMYGDTVQSFDPVTGARETEAEVFHAAGLGWLPDGRMLVVATEDKKLIEVGPEGNRTYADLGALSPGWVNDMLVDQDGRAYVGNFGYDLFTEEPRATNLLVVQPDGSVERQDDEVVFPNGTVRRSDGTLVVSESFAHRIAIFDVAEDGTATLNHRVQLDDDVVPDGMCVDAEDGVWFATLGHDVMRLGVDGSIERVAVSAPTYACMLGGADRRTLYVATAPDYEPDARRRLTESRIESVRVAVPGAGADGVDARVLGV